MLLVPSVFVASTTLSFDANFRTNIAFVLSGPFCLGVSALFCYDKKVTKKQLNNMLVYMVMPLISHTAYIFFYNPSVRDVLTGTGSNRAASGGWGANQVATVLGLGMFIIAIRLFSKSAADQGESYARHPVGRPRCRQGHTGQLHQGEVQHPPDFYR